MSDKKKKPQFDELDEMARRTDNSLMNPIMQPIAVGGVATPGADTKQVPARRRIYDSIFGESPATQAAREERDSAFQAMLDARKQTVSQQRTDDVRMARLNAMGNLLTTMVQPIGWGIGGRTGNTQPYDDRQYIAAFNRAVKANDDLRNIGTLEGEYKFNLADEKFKRMQSLDDEARRRQQKIEDEERSAKLWADKQEQKQADELEKIAARGDVQKWLAEYRAAHRVTRGGLSVEDRAIIAARKEYETFKRGQMNKGLAPPSFEDYMKGKGYEVNTNPGANPTKQITEIDWEGTGTSTTAASGPTIDWD